MRTIHGVAFCALTTLALLAGCTKDGSPSAAPPELPSKPATSTAVDDAAGQDRPETNERGNIVKELGEDAGFGTKKPENQQVTFTIDSIEVDPPCFKYGRPPAEGHTLLLHVRVATGTNAQLAQSTGGILNPAFFSELDSDGVTHSAQSGSCTDFKSYLTYNYGPNQKYVGTIELVVPEASGVVILAPPGIQGGWEWHY